MPTLKQRIPYNLDVQYQPFTHVPHLHCRLRRKGPTSHLGCNIWAQCLGL